MTFSTYKHVTMSVGRKGVNRNAILTYGSPPTLSNGNEVSSYVVIKKI